MQKYRYIQYSANCKRNETGNEESLCTEILGTSYSSHRISKITLTEKMKIMPAFLFLFFVTKKGNLKTLKSFKGEFLRPQ